MIVRSGQAHFVIHQRAAPENQVRVAIDESRHDHAAGCIDLSRAFRSGEGFHFAAGAGCLDASVANEHCAVAYQAKIAQRRAAPRAGRSSQGEKLARSSQQDCAGHSDFAGGLRIGARKPAWRAKSTAG